MKMWKVIGNSFFVVALLALELAAILAVWNDISGGSSLAGKLSVLGAVFLINGGVVWSAIEWHQEDERKKRRDEQHRLKLAELRELRERREAEKAEKESNS